MISTIFMKNTRNSKNKNGSASLETFTTWSDEIVGRIDPFFYRPEIKQVSEELRKAKGIPFGEIIQSITNGLDYRQFEDKGSTIYLRVGNIKPHKIIFDDAKRVNFNIDEIAKDIHLNKGDILLTRKGSFGISVALTENIDALISSEIFLIRLNRKDINPNYVEVFLNSSICQKQFQSQKVGAIMGSLSQDAVKDILIPIPPLSVQNEVVKEIQEAYKQRQEREAKIENILLSIDDFVFGEIGIDIPKESPERVFQIWSNEIEGRLDVLFYKPILLNLLDQITRQRHFTLGEAITEMSGGATPKVTEDYYLDEGGVPFLRVQNITEMGINLDDVKFIKPKVNQTMLKRSQLKKDDLVFTITGRIGSVAVVPENFDGNINQHSVRIHLQNEVDKTKILPEYVAVFFNTKAGRDLSFRYTTGGTRPALDYEALRELVVPLPSEEIQKRIVGGVNSFYERIRALKMEADEVLCSAQKQVEQMILA